MRSLCAILLLALAPLTHAQSALTTVSERSGFVETGRYEEVVAHAARARGVDGVVCGHIHSAEMRVIDGVNYYYDGDWVEGCTALVEHHDGTMEILHWAQEVAARSAPAQLSLPAPARAA